VAAGGGAGRQFSVKEDQGMGEEKRVKDIMAHIDEYDRVNA